MKKKIIKNKILFSCPGSSLSNKTGSWRTFRPKVDFNKCIGCGSCVKVCPDGAITLKKIKNKEKAIINYDYCKGCGICAVECPHHAIIMIREEN